MTCKCALFSFICAMRRPCDRERMESSDGVFDNSAGGGVGVNAMPAAGICENLGYFDY